MDLIPQYYIIEEPTFILLDNLKKTKFCLIIISFWYIKVCFLWEYLPSWTNYDQFV